MPPYEQIRGQLATMIASGVLRPGDQLPSIRQLAADLGLAANTVARSYRELVAAGLGADAREARDHGASTAETTAPQGDQAPAG